MPVGSPATGSRQHYFYFRSYSPQPARPANDEYLDDSQTLRIQKAAVCGVTMPHSGGDRDGQPLGDGGQPGRQRTAGSDEYGKVELASQ